MAYLSDFYRHNSFMQSVKEGERMIARDMKALAKMKRETTNLKVGDIVESTGKGCEIEGIKAKIIEIEYNGKFLSFFVDWDYNSRAKKHCKTFERKQDIRKA